MKRRIDITLEEILIEKFRKYCKKEGMKISTRIELLISKDMRKR